jgi:rubrerythrin
MRNIHKFIAALAVSFALNPALVRAQPPSSPEGREALKTAMLDEAFASAKYKLFAEHARRAGNADLAHLMEVAANMEYGHFLRWAELYRLVGSDVQNVRAAVDDEINDDVKLYERLAAEAQARGEKGLAEHFDQVRAQEEKQQDAFKQAVERTLKAQ